MYQEGIQGFLVYVRKCICQEDIQGFLVYVRKYICQEDIQGLFVQMYFPLVNLVSLSSVLKCCPSLMNVS